MFFFVYLLYTLLRIVIQAYLAVICVLYLLLPYEKKTMDMQATLADIYSFL